MRKAGDYSEKEKRKAATLCERKKGQQSLVRRCSPSDAQAWGMASVAATLLVVVTKYLLRGVTYGVKSLVWLQTEGWEGIATGT